MAKRSSIKKYNKLALGFNLDRDEVSRLDGAELLNSSDEWEAFVGILLSCQSGDFGQLLHIPRLMRQFRDWLFWKAATDLVGCAGSWSFVRQFARDFADQVAEPGVQHFLSSALSECGGLWAVEPLLELHAAAADEDRRYQIEGQLSYLLEEEDGSIWHGADETTVLMDPEKLEFATTVDYESFAQEVRAVRDQVIEQIGSTTTPMSEGRVLDVIAIAERLHKRLTSESGDEAKGRIDRGRLLFEASTGIDCRSFFDAEGRLQRLPAAAILEDFLESDLRSRFQPGRRYFFGHPILD